MFVLSQLLDEWLRSIRPGFLTSGELWLLLLSPLFVLIAFLALRRVSPRAKNTAGVLFLALTLVTLVLVRLPLLHRDTLNMDEAFLLSSAMRLQVDPVAYRSVDSGTSGPLNIYALTVPALFRVPFTYVSSRMLGIAFAAGTLLFLWLTFRLFLSERAARIVLLPICVFYLTSYDMDVIHCSSEQLPVLFCAIVVYLLARDFVDAATPSTWRLAVAAALATAMIFAKLQALPVVGVLLLAAAAVAWRKPSRWYALSAVIAGAAAVPAFFVFLFSHYGVLQHFLHSYIERNTAYAGAAAPSLPGRFRMAAGLLRKFFPAIFGFLMIWAAALAAILSRYNSRLRSQPAPILFAAAAVFAAAGFVAVAGPGNPYPHYLFFLLVPAAILTMSSSAAILAVHGESRSRLAALLLLTCLVPAVWNAHQSGSPRSSWTINPLDPTKPLVRLVQRYSTPQECIVVWGWNSPLYIAAQRAPGTRFADSVLPIEPSGYREFFQSEYVQDVAASHAPVFVDAVGPFAFSYTDRAAQGYESVPALRTLVDRDYQQVADISGSRVFVRRDRLRYSYRSAITGSSLAALFAR